MKISIGARVKHPSFGEGIVINEDEATWSIFFRGEDKQISKTFDDFELLEYGFESVEEEVVSEGVSLENMQSALRNIIEEMSDIQHVVELGAKWEGGTMTLQPANKDLKPKEIPIETFFHKIVMMRDRLRVLEQNVNSHKVLTDQDKVSLQQYITRCYGSMTTFNIFFADKEDYFSGS